MKAIVLAAGYATRLHPLTLDRPKPLLEVGGRTILDRLLDRLTPIETIDGLYVVTNSKFAPQFRDWASAFRPPRDGLAPVVVDDGTRDDETKLGAIGDLGFAVERESLEGDLLVAAGDSLFTENLDGFGRFCMERNAPAEAVYDVGDLEAIKRYSAIELDDDDRIVSFEEKPAHPTSTLAGIALYFYPRSVVPLVHTYLAEGNDPDQPGRLVEWLYPQLPVYGWRVPGRWYDIGSEETLAEADRAFSH
jgi:glucose-1-phosphate thymidylyltransferase